jgi:hypothetical protein
MELEKQNPTSEINLTVGILFAGEGVYAKQTGQWYL